MHPAPPPELNPLRLSVVVPLYNEEGNITPLLAALAAALAAVEHEVILVDDGSTDGTVAEAMAAAAGGGGAPLTLLTFARNYGQTSAIAAGIDQARGEYIVTLDGDLQNDPRDIPAMLAQLEADGLDLIVGYRAQRQDGALLRKLPSRIANWIIRRTTRVQVRDYGCTLKLFRRSLARRLELYGELHRFIPILCVLHGGKMAERPVRHHRRLHGVSKYGLGRTLRVLSDLLLMLFFLRYRQRPMHLFGTMGIVLFLAGTLMQVYLLAVKIGGEDIGGRPLFYVGLLCLITGVQLVTAGFLAELIMRTYYESQGKKPYLVSTVWHHTPAGNAPADQTDPTP